MGESSSFLFARLSLSEGAARIFDFAGALNQYNTTPTGESADRRALEADWQAIGGDIQDAVQREAQSIKTQ